MCLFNDSLRVDLGIGVVRGSWGILGTEFSSGV